MFSRWLSRAVLSTPLLSPLLYAEIRLPQILSDHAVLQRNAPIHIWGWATPSARVTIRFDKQTRAAVADEAGEWSAWLMPEAAGEPYTLTVEGDGSTLTRGDILVGDVWLAFTMQQVCRPGSSRRRKRRSSSAALSRRIDGRSSEAR